MCLFFRFVDFFVLQYVFFNDWNFCIECFLMYLLKDYRMNSFKRKCSIAFFILSIEDSYDKYMPMFMNQLDNYTILKNNQIPDITLFFLAVYQIYYLYTQDFYQKSNVKKIKLFNRAKLLWVAIGKIQAFRDYKHIFLPLIFCSIFQLKCALNMHNICTKKVLIGHWNHIWL